LHELRDRISDDRHAEAAITAAGLGVEVVVLFRGVELAVRIVQFFDEPASGFLVDIRERQGVDVFDVDELEHLLQQLDAGALLANLPREASGDDRNNEERAEERELPFACHAMCPASGVFRTITPPEQNGWTIPAVA